MRIAWMLTALIGLPDRDRFRDAFRTAAIAWQEWLRVDFWRSEMAFLKYITSWRISLPIWREEDQRGWVLFSPILSRAPTWSKGHIGHWISWLLIWDLLVSCNNWRLIDFGRRSVIRILNPELTLLMHEMVLIDIMDCPFLTPKDLLKLRLMMVSLASSHSILV